MKIRLKELTKKLNDTKELLNSVENDFDADIFYRELYINDLKWEIYSLNEVIEYKKTFNKFITILAIILSAIFITIGFLIYLTTTV
jgi:flagellar hook-associated protein FlgK